MTAAQSGPGTGPAEADRHMDILRLATAGSVDDGKSTLIGRLLYDSKSIFEDQLAAVERTSRERGEGYTNLALLTDGLRAEREQGITIDVAYRYFATPRRKFIIADTPGHVQYTRNMVTGASTADLAVVLVDARNGLTEQSRRHAFLATLLRVPHLVLAVNKMDLVGYDAGGLRADRRGVHRVRRQAGDRRPHLHPDLRAARRQRGAALGEHALVRRAVAAAPPGARAHRLRPEPDRRPVPGAVRHPAAPGHRPGTARLPRLRGPGRRRRAQARRRGHAPAVRADHDDRSASTPRHGPVAEAFPPMSVTVLLADDLDVSRGDMLCRPHNQPAAAQDIEAMVCWMSDIRPLAAGSRLIVKHTTRTVQGHRPRPAVPARREHPAPGRARGPARPERDRPGDAAHDPAAVL